MAQTKTSTRVATAGIAAIVVTADTAARRARGRRLHPPAPATDIDTAGFFKEAAAARRAMRRAARSY